MSEARLPYNYEPIAVSSESTVVAEYIAQYDADAGYQSESALEQEFIKQLERQAYEFLRITSEEHLIVN